MLVLIEDSEVVRVLMSFISFNFVQRTSAFEGILGVIERNFGMKSNRSN